MDKNKRFIIFTILLFTLNLAYGLTDADWQDAERKYNQALSELDNKNYSGAAENFNAAYTLIQDRKIKFNYFRALYLAGKYNAVVDEGNEYLSRTPHFEYRLKVTLQALIKNSEPRMVSQFRGSFREAPGSSSSSFRYRPPPPPPLIQVNEARVNVFVDKHVAAKNRQRAEQARIEREKYAAEQRKIRDERTRMARIEQDRRYAEQIRLQREREVRARENRIAAEKNKNSLKKLSGLRSIHGNTKTSITFKNQWRKVIKGYWIDYKGIEVLYFRLNPGDAHRQETYATHPWVVRDEQTGMYLLHVIADEQHRNVYVN